MSYSDPQGLTNPLLAACAGGPNPACLAGAILAGATAYSATKAVEGTYNAINNNGGSNDPLNISPSNGTGDPCALDPELCQDLSRNEDPEQCPTRFSNQAPNDPISSPDTQNISQIIKTGQSGRFNYVVTLDNKLIIGRSGLSRPNGHINLAQGSDVQAAGEAKFVNGQLQWIDNFSGHYRPYGAHAKNTAISAFEKNGAGTAKYFERTFR